MKSIIKLSAITLLAAFALVGCNQNTTTTSTDTNSPPAATTNMPASTNK